MTLDVARGLENAINAKRHVADSAARRGCGRRGLCDGHFGRVGLCPANGRGAGVSHRGTKDAMRRGGMAALGREEGWRRGRTTYFGETFAQHREPFAFTPAAI
jgi:hypothetical protein